MIRSEGEHVPIGRVHKGKADKAFKYKPPRKNVNPLPYRGKSCSWCGKLQVHDRTKCPAKDSTCSKCQKKGNFGRICRSVTSVEVVA